MQVCNEKLDTDYSIQVFESISAIEEKIWNSVHTIIPFYQTHAFLSVIESIQPDIPCRYILLSKGDKIIATVYVQLLDFSFRNLVNYSDDTSTGFKKKFKNYFAQKNTRLLNIGNVFFTGDKGIIAEDDTVVIEKLPEIFRRIQKTITGKKPSASLIANIYLQDEGKCLTYCNSSFHSFTTEPDMFMKVDESWKSFDDYMDALSSKYRVRTKKVLTVSKDIERREFSLEDIREQKPALQNLYNNVVSHVAFNMATLNVDFFEKMKALYDDKCTVFGYYLNNELVSYACLFNVDPDILHVHYIGLNYEVNREYKLYNRMLLDFVCFAIENNVQHIHFGRTATEIKTTIGAEPRPLQAYLKMNNRLVNATLPYLLKRIKPAEYIARNPFK